VLTYGPYTDAVPTPLRPHSPPADRTPARNDDTVALHLARAGWLILGVALLSGAHWPPSCTPEGWLDIVGAYRCSLRLTEQRGWMEAALLTWLWATPILATMGLLRWIRR
jgi:hypothetical protein